MTQSRSVEAEMVMMNLYKMIYFQQQMSVDTGGALITAVNSLYITQ